jgi:hypothetical protein
MPDPRAAAADGHAPNVEVGALGHRGDRADDRVRELGDPDRTLRRALGDLIRGRGRRAERSRRVERFELGKRCSQRSGDRPRIAWLGKPNGHAARVYRGSGHYGTAGLRITFQSPGGG